MANQQLVDYVKGQFQAGVKEEDIKKVLKDAGWPDAEIIDGVSAAKGPVVANPVAQAVSSAPIQSTQFAGQIGLGASANPKINAFGGSLSSSSVAATSAQKPEEKKEAMKFDFMSNPIASKGSGETTTFKAQEAKSEVFPTTGSDTPVATSVAPTGKKNLLPWILFIVAIIALGVTAPLLYMNGLSAKESVISLQSQLGAVQSQLISLEGSGADATNQLSVLNSEKQDLLDELALFATPALISVASGTSTETVMQMPTSVAFRVKGTVTQDSRDVYYITTARNIVLTIKNSKDVNLDTALKPMVDQNVFASFSGVHAPLSKELTVESVNGTAVK